MTFTNRRDLVKTFPRHGRVVEIGVFRGDFSQFIVNHCAPEHLFMVDSWAWTHPQHSPLPSKDRKDGQPLGEDIYLECVKRFWGRPECTILRTTSHRAAALFADGYLDWAYIDANHTYEACAEDIELWFAKVRSGGVLAGHDYNAGVEAAVKDFVAKHPELTLQSTEEECASWWFLKP